MNLLIIEDSEAYAMIVKRYLESLAESILIYHEWKDEIMEKIKDYDVLWFDLHVPGIEVKELVELIGKIRLLYGEAVIIVVSGFLNKITIERLESMGVDAMADKSQADDPKKIISLLLLGMMKAMKRGAKGTRLQEIAAKASALIAEPLPLVNENGYA